MSLRARRRRSYVSRGEVKATVVLVHGGAEVASWPLPTQGRADVSLVDELARLQLAARRLGCSIRLRGACSEVSDVLDLLDLVGLAEIIGRIGGLVVEVSGEPKGGEEVGVEERVERGDPVA
jgi:hypothetical protein